MIIVIDVLAKKAVIAAVKAVLGVDVRVPFKVRCAVPCVLQDGSDACLQPPASGADVLTC